MRLGNGLWEQRRYNNRLQVEEISLGTSSTDASKLKLEYGYEAPQPTGTPDPTRNNGNLRSQTISVAVVGQVPAQTFTQTYSYDALNRLQAAAESNAAGLTWTEGYAYDRYGNRGLVEAQTQRLNSQTQLVAVIDAANRAALNPTLSQATNRVSQEGYAYDVAGNLLCDSRHPCAPQASPVSYFDYDGESKLMRAGGGAQAGGAEYVYDGEGRRVKKVVGAVTTVFVYDGAGRLVVEYSNEPRPAQTSSTSYVTQDSLGSTRVVTGQGQEVKGRYDYLPFGEEVTAGRAGYGGGSIRQKFTGYERDEETRLDYAQARYYANMQGRFTSVDPLAESARVDNPQTLNRYSYVTSNPLNVIDPTGMCPDCDDDESEPVRTDSYQLHTSWLVRMGQRWYDWVNGLLEEGWRPGQIKAFYGIDILAHSPTATAVSSGNESAQKVEPYIQMSPLGAYYNTLMAGRYANLGQGSQSDVLLNATLIPFEFTGLGGTTRKQAAKAAVNVLDTRLADIVKRHGGTALQGAVDSIRFPSRRVARQAASEMAGDLGSAPRAILASDFRGGPYWMSNSSRVIGRESLDGTRMWRDDFLGHPRFNMGPHVNVSINGRDFHFFY